MKRAEILVFAQRLGFRVFISFGAMKCFWFRRLTVCWIRKRKEIGLRLGLWGMGEVVRYMGGCLGAGVWV